MLNRVILMGRLTRDPELRQTQAGVACCRFSIAINRQFANKQTGERESDFVECETWRQTAEFVSRYFVKGNMILVEGELRNNNYEDSKGVKHYGMKVLVSNVSFCESKGSSENQQQEAPTQVQKTTAAPRAAAPAQEALSLDDLDEFEEILSDGDVPF